MSLFDDIEAFEPFFDSTVGYTGQRDGYKINTQFTASIYPVEDITPLADFDLSTQIQKCIVIIKAKDWIIKKSKPQVGDVIQFEDGSKWSISNVKLVQKIYRIEVKEN